MKAWLKGQATVLSLTPEAQILQARHKFCGYCGAPMREILHAYPTFDRETGKPGDVGDLHWQCPHHGIGLDAAHGEWLVAGYEDNPHDSIFLKKVTASEP